MGINGFHIIKKNIKIRYAINDSLKKITIFKGDCDQDRPS